MKTGHFALAILLAFGMGAITATAQQSADHNGTDAAVQSPQPDALAAAARRTREERKDQPTAAKIYTNDNLPTNARISYVGSGVSASTAKDVAASGANATAGNQNANAGAKAGGGGDKTAQEAELAKAKQQLESAKKDLDIVQRKFTLDQQDYLTNPNHDGDKQTAATLQAEQDAISAKKDEVDAAQKVVSDLKAQLDAANEAASSAPATTSTRSNTAAATDNPANGPAARKNSGSNNVDSRDSINDNSGDSNSAIAVPVPASPTPDRQAPDNTNAKTIPF